MLHHEVKTENEILHTLAIAARAANAASLTSGVPSFKLYSTANKTASI
jgi:hypothetical protein